MDSKERVLRAINYQETDRVPVGIFGTAKDYQEGLAKYINASSIEEMHKILGIDIWHGGGGLHYTGEERYYNGEKTDIWGIPISGYLQGDPGKKGPLREVSSIDEVEAYKWPSVDNFSSEGLLERIEEHSYFAVEGGIHAPIFHLFTWLCGQERALMSLLTEPDLSKAIIGKITDFYVGYLKIVLQAGKGKIDIIENCNDFGTQRSMFMSPDTFREFFKPALKRIYDITKEYGAKVMQHSCGAIDPIIPDLIEIGVDILNPIQVAADNMNICDLHRKYKGKLTFYGAIDTQELLPKGPIDKIQKEVRKTIDLFGKEGGYILSGSQGFIEDISYDHALAMFEEAKS